MDENEKRVHGCDSDTCQYHVLTESIIKDLRDAVGKLMDGQEQMRETVIHLTEAFKAMEKIDKRILRMEDLARDVNKGQDAKIDELRAFMYKSMGAITVLTVAGSALLRYLGIC